MIHYDIKTIITIDCFYKYINFNYSLFTKNYLYQEAYLT